MWIVLAASILIVVVSVAFRQHGDDDTSARPTPVGDPTASATGTVAPSPTATPSVSPTASASAKPSPGANAGSPGMGSPGDAVNMNGWKAPLPPGLSGSGGNASLPKIKIHLEVFSAEPIGIVGYQVPTSLTDSSGTVRNVGTHWSLDTIGYGNPDYARLFFGAGPSGTPVTCIIRVNGKVTERRSTDGPYGRTMCQG